MQTGLQQRSRKNLPEFAFSNTKKKQRNGREALTGGDEPGDAAPLISDTSVPPTPRREPQRQCELARRCSGEGDKSVCVGWQLGDGAGSDGPADARKRDGTSDQEPGRLSPEELGEEGACEEETHAQGQISGTGAEASLCSSEEDQVR